MKKLYTIITLFVMGAIASAMAAEHPGQKYVGNIIINMGEDITLPDQAVYIENTGDNKCTFSLYDFRLAPADQDPDNESLMGDITVPNVSMTTADGVTTYNGSKDGLVLENVQLGRIEANVIVEGTENAAGELKMAIHVIWIIDAASGQTMPIEVRFEGKRDNSGIDAIEADTTDAAPAYYDAYGRQLQSAPQSGLYIERRAGKTMKHVAR